MSDSFFASFQSQAINETIVKGDTVRVIGKDEYKGHIGIVVSVEEISGEPQYIVELQVC